MSPTRRLRVGVIGLGEIAQIMHLPYLRELEERYEIAAICDISPQLVARIGDLYGVDHRYTDFRALVAQPDLDAVFVLTPYHFQPALAALQQGKHVLVEKPMCTNLREADTLIETAARNGCILMVAYMKRYDPGYLYGQRKIQEIPDIRLVELHDIIGPNALFIREAHRVYRFDDQPRDLIAQQQAEYQAAITEAIGPVPPHVRQAYSLMLGLSVHDVTILCGAVGRPRRVLTTHIWDDGRFFSSLLDYGDFLCTFTTGRTEMRRFDEVLRVYGRQRVVTISFPSPYIRNMPTLVHVEEMADGAFTDCRVEASYEEAFKRELIHFHECVTEKRRPLTSGEEGRADIALLIQMIEAYKRGAGAGLDPAALAQTTPPGAR